MNILATTNHSFTYKIEDGDARILPLNVSNRYYQKFGYFKRLGESLNQHTGNHFLSFLKERDIRNVTLTDIPMTDLKEDMIEHSLPSPIRFLNDVKEDNDYLMNKIGRGIDWKGVKSKDLFQGYCYWCTENNEKKMSNTAFGKVINVKYEKRRTNNGYMYDLEELRLMLCVAVFYCCFGLIISYFIFCLVVCCIVRLTFIVYFGFILYFNLPLISQ